MARFGRWQMGMGIVWVMALCLGCKNSPPDVSQATKAASQDAETQTHPQPSCQVYPKDLEFGGDLDIIVVQQRKTLTFTNRTTHAYDNVELWVNQRYITHVDHLGIGKGTTIALASLTNRYGESYPVPGFLRPDRSFPALLVEMIDLKQGKRFRLHVRSKP